jgi:hypothetical protein
MSFTIMTENEFNNECENFLDIYDKSHNYTKLNILSYLKVGIRKVNNYIRCGVTPVNEKKDFVIHLLPLLEEDTSFEIQDDVYIIINTYKNLYKNCDIIPKVYIINHLFTNFL